MTSITSSPTSAYGFSSECHSTLVHEVSSVHELGSKANITHLSGATMADLISEPKIHLVTASPAISKRSSAVSSMNSKRHSTASTTKSALRHSNHLLIELLQNIQTELSTHRSIMLDIQHRVSHLEYESSASSDSDASQQSALQALEGGPIKDNSRLIPPEGQTWWEACRNFARNSEEPMSARDFLRTPKRFSGFDWQYGPQPSRPHTPPQTPPDVEDLPALTPTSETGEHSDLQTPKGKHNIDITVDEIITSTPRMSVDDEIKEHTVEISKKKLPPAPTLQPPPSGKAISVNNEEVVSAVAPIDPTNPHRFYKGMKSAATYKALLKNKKTEKEHYVLIHFHKASELKNLAD